MTNNFIQKNLHFFINAVKEYGEDAKLLIEKFSRLYNLDLDNKMPINTFWEIKNDSQNGLMNENWLYFFHGYECRFKNLKSGHIIEVILTFGDEYGVLNPIFIAKYIDTNPKYFNKNLEITNEFEIGSAIIEVLKTNNKLLEIENTGSVLIDMLENDTPLYVEQKFRGLRLNPALSDL